MQISALEQDATTTEPVGRRRRQLLSGVLYLGLTLVAVYVIVPQFLGQDKDQVLPLLQAVRPEYLTLAIGFEAARYFCFGLVARALAALLGRRIPRVDSAQMMLASYALSRIFSLGGAMAFVVRMQFFLRHGLTAGRTLALFITHNVLSGIALLVTYVIGVSVLWSRGELEGVRLFLALGWLVVVIVAASVQVTVGWHPGFLEQAFQKALAQLRMHLPLVARHSLTAGLVFTTALLALGVIWQQGAAPGVEQGAARVWLAACAIAMVLQIYVASHPRWKRVVRVGLARRLPMALRGGWSQPGVSQRFAQELSAGVRATFGNWRGLPQAFVFQASGLAADIVTLIIAAQALQVPMSPVLLVAAYIIAYYAQLIAPTPGEAGAMEFALLGVLIALGLTPLQATTTTLLFRFVSFWLPIPFGLLAYFNLKRQGKI